MHAYAGRTYRNLFTYQCVNPYQKTNISVDMRSNTYTNVDQLHKYIWNIYNNVIIVYKLRATICLHNINIGAIKLDLLAAQAKRP